MSNYFKYPKTFHIPTSPNLQNDDRRIESMEPFHNQRVIVSLKVDGEGTSIYRDKIHARSIDSKDHPSRHWVKQLHASIKHEIPDGWRICGENCYALHSIYYTELPSYFLVFGIYNEKNECLSWDETVEYCQLLNLETVPVVYDGIYNAEKIQNIYENSFILGGYTPKDDIDYFEILTGTKSGPDDTWHGLAYSDFNNFRDLIVKKYDIKTFAEKTEEGYVIRIANSFKYEDFQKSVSKYVRLNHVSSSDNWMTQQVIENKLKR